MQTRQQRMRDRRSVDLRALVSNERGATALFLAAGMSVFLSATAIAVDLGMLANARTEAQRVADSAALAGASSLVFVPGDEKNARQWAKDYAAKNTIRGQPIVLRDQDIQIVGSTVRVWVLRTQEAGGQVPTTFARIMGIDGVDISATAVAEASDQAVAVGCLLPITVADRWVNFGTPEWDPSEGDYYEPPYRPDGSPNRNYVGYDQVGELFTLSPSEGGKSSGPPVSSRVMPSVYNLWLPESVQGTPELRVRVIGCPEQDGPLGPGDPMWREAGNVQDLVDEFRQILSDPEYSGQYYDDGCACVRDANNGHEVVTGGLRYRVVPIHDISKFTKQGSGSHADVSHFIGVFIDSVDPGPKGKANVYARVMPALGRPGGGVNPAGPLVRAVRLIE